MRVILLIMLSWYSYMDIREKRLPVVWVWTGIAISAVLGVFANVGFGDKTLGEGVAVLLLGMVPGGLLVLLASALKGRIGCGDGLVLIIITNLVGVQAGIVIWFTAMGLSFLYSCILLIICRKKKNYCFPFVPFYLIGTLILYGFGAG